MTHQALDKMTQEEREKLKFSLGLTNNIPETMRKEIRRGKIILFLKFLAIWVAMAAILIYALKTQL